jgi:hypothetical protein
MWGRNLVQTTRLDPAMVVCLEERNETCQRDTIDNNSWPLIQPSTPVAK